MEIKNLAFGYEKKNIINNITTRIPKGKITTIIGPNGCGKSTLLNLCVKQLNPQKGMVLLDGKELVTISAKEMAKRLAIVYQQNEAPSDLTVKRLVEYGRSPYQTFFSNQDEEGEAVVDWALTMTNLKGMSKKRISELSGGERQRAWIAMALAQKTELLFLDEPTTYLDIYYQLEVLRLVKKLNETCNMTIVMVLHDINQALQFSDHLIIMKAGEIQYQGDAASGINEKRLKEVYGIDADVLWSDSNRAPYIVPII